MTQSQVRNSETSELFKCMHLARRSNQLIWLCMYRELNRRGWRTLKGIEWHKD